MIKKGGLINRYKLFVFILTVLFHNGYVFAQYKYTRIALEGTAGTNYGLTSVPGSFAAFSEVGLRLSLSRYLSGKLSYGVGALRGSRTVNTAVLPLDDVNNYVEYNTTYRYLNGRALINLERVFKLRQRNRIYNRLNPFLVIGGGFMFPDIEVNRVDGQFKNYRKNVRFYTNCYGLDFRYFLSNRFDLTFGSELHVIQTYYLDGAYSDQKLDKFITGHIGICYNVGANADRKHLEWFNLDGKEDVIFRPIEINPTAPQEPISQIDPPKESEKPNAPVDSAIAVINEPTPDAIAIDSADNTVDLTIDNDGSIIPVKVDSSSTVKEPKVTPTKPIDVQAPPQSTATVVNPPVESKKPVEPMITEPTKPTTTTPEIAQQPKQPTPEKPVIITPPLSRYNVIAATYGGPKYAVLYCKKLRTLGFDANVIKSSKSKMYRISIYHGDDRAIALRELARIRKTEFKQAWIHIYNP
ncbi:MAG: hypothetical protein EAY81_04195 [Bacteroidetes bacterium]|nr:MAG: hypothetical protein EAY81_04195 [Bacteroidota bacterium]